jgi:hypothetical protein
LKINGTQINVLHVKQHIKRRETEELMAEYSGLGPWIFIYLQYLLPVASKNVSTNMVGSVSGFSSIHSLPVAAKNANGGKGPWNFL